MFVENYRQETANSLMAGGDAKPVPYPKISAEDWGVWKELLPIKRGSVGPEEFSTPVQFDPYLGVPIALQSDIREAGKHFDKVEVWAKTDLNKDPIAVGILAGDRYLVARWGMEKLIPFERIKKTMPLIHAWQYATSPFGVLAASCGLSFAAWALLV